MKKQVSVFLLLIGSFFLAACSDEQEVERDNNQQIMGSSAVVSSSQSGTQKKREPWYTQDMVPQGKKLFQQNCAQCHGGFAQGNPNWRQPLDNGRYLPPPLNGSGHAWHHPLDQLRGVIKYGRGPDIPSDMPAWGDKLNDQEIDSVIAWFQSRWPDEIYQAWSRPKQ